MKKPIDLKAVFGHFAGREVPMQEKMVTLESGRSYPVIGPVNKDDPVMRDMEETAKAHGLQMRFWWADRIGSYEVNRERVNAFIEKEPDGVWRVASRFYFG